MNLESVGVEYNAKGVIVDDFMARIVIQNAIFKGSKRASSFAIP